MAANKKLNGKRRLRSREWFDAPGDPTMAAVTVSVAAVAPAIADAPANHW